MERKPRIVVVGAGIAGIGTATRLWELGFTDVTLLEASGEAGGRVAKSQLGKAWVDIGAQFIHGATETNPIYCLAKKYGLLNNLPKEGGNWQVLSAKTNKVNLEFAERVYDAGEQIIRLKFQGSPEKSIMEHLAEQTRLLMSKWEARGENIAQIKGLLNMVGKDMLVETGASDLHDVSLGSWRHFPDNMGEDLNIEGNMYHLISNLLEDFPKDKLLLKKDVSKIEWDGSFTTSEDGPEYPVRVTYGDGEQMLADHVVVTISLGCLKAQAASLFSPELPEYKKQAIESLSFGSIAKIFLEYEEAFWGSDVTDISLLSEDETPDSVKVDATEWIKNLHVFTVTRPQEKFGNVLIAWCAGRVAELVENLTEEELSKAITERLRMFTHNPALPAPKKVFCTQWHKNPYTRGTYTYVPKGTDVDVMDNLAIPLSSRKGTDSDLQVLFAGEATMKTLYSTLQGAFLSGQREAERLALHHHKTVPPSTICSLPEQE